MLNDIILLSLVSELTTHQLDVRGKYYCSVNDTLVQIIKDCIPRQSPSLLIVIVMAIVVFLVSQYDALEVVYAVRITGTFIATLSH